MTDWDPNSFTALGFFPADHAAAESGKVYASGAYWGTLHFPEFPAVLPSMALVAVVQQPFSAAHADHEFAIGLENPDGHAQSLDIRGSFRAAPGLESRYGEPNVIPIIVPVHGLPFDGPGDFAFVLRVDGTELARYPIRVIAAAA
ncbi:MAG: hypothetical protein JWP11_2200 [Frankiales bacterium]|jgi:hypothetical protein|nr:hypothetical protein [Frankiales bacterium]